MAKRPILMSGLMVLHGLISEGEGDSDLALETMTALHGMLIAAGLVGEADSISGEQAVQIARAYLQERGL